MAYELIWSPLSREDLRDIVRYISRDSPQRAQSFALRLIAQADRLLEHSRVVAWFLSITFRTSARSFSGHTGLFTAWITSGGWSRFHECGTQPEELQKSPWPPEKLAAPGSVCADHS